MFFIAILTLSLTAHGQTSYKQVYDKALELQIRSSVGVDEDGHWKFHPGWYYDIFHSSYKSRKHENNNIVQLDSIIEATRESMYKVIKAREDIEVIYQHELAHWNDRNNDRELSLVKKQLEDTRDALFDVMSEFIKYRVSVSDASKLYQELGRIDDKVNIISKAHLDNQKRRQGFEKCLVEYNELINICYKICNMSQVAYQYTIVSPE
jgi:hypothetical protein